MWELDYKETWALKNWFFWTVMLEKTLQSSLDCKEIKPVHSKGNKSWIFIGRTDAEAEAPVFWPPEANSLLNGNDPDAGKDWGQEEKGTTEHEMAGWHHPLNGHGFEQTPGNSEGRGSLACCSPRGHKESDTAEWLNNNHGTVHKTAYYCIHKGSFFLERNFVWFERIHFNSSMFPYDSLALIQCSWA